MNITSEQAHGATCERRCIKAVTRGHAGKRKHPMTHLHMHEHYPARICLRMQKGHTHTDTCKPACVNTHAALARDESAKPFPPIRSASLSAWSPLFPHPPCLFYWIDGLLTVTENRGSGASAEKETVWHALLRARKHIITYGFGRHKHTHLCRRFFLIHKLRKWDLAATWKKKKDARTCGWAHEHIWISYLIFSVASSLFSSAGRERQGVGRQQRGPPMARGCKFIKGVNLLSFSTEEAKSTVMDPRKWGQRLHTYLSSFLERRLCKI